MKAISLWQPWATWVAMKWKTIETRTHDRFKSLKGQRIAIHAAKKLDPLEFGNQYLPKMDALQIQNLVGLSILFRGRITCTAKIIDTRWAPNVDFDLHEEWNRKAMCNVGGKYLLFLDEIEPVTDRIYVRGRQGIFNVPDELIYNKA